MIYILKHIFPVFICISKFVIIFAPELKWKDLYCLQPREKMLKTIFLLFDYL